MMFFRCLFKILAIVCWYPVFYLLVVADNAWRGKWQGVSGAVWWTGVWAKSTAALIGMKISVYGDISKAAGKLVISNHTGYLDVIAQGVLFPVRFAPKAEMRHWPFFGWLVAISRPVWVDRENRSRSAAVADEIRETLEHGFSMLVYPEGTSTDGRHGLLPFKSTAFEAAVRSGSTLLPVLVMHRGVPADGCDPAWYGDIGFLPHVLGVLGLKEIHSCVYIMPEVAPLPGESRKELAQRVYGLMSEQYEKVCSSVDGEFIGEAVVD